MKSKKILVDIVRIFFNSHFNFFDGLFNITLVERRWIDGKKTIFIWDPKQNEGAISFTLMFILLFIYFQARMMSYSNFYTMKLIAVFCVKLKGGNKIYFSSFILIHMYKWQILHLLPNSEYTIKGKKLYL